MYKHLNLNYLWDMGSSYGAAVDEHVYLTKKVKLLNTIKLKKNNNNNKKTKQTSKIKK